MLVIDDLGSGRLSILTGCVGIGGSTVWLRQGRDGVEQQAEHSFPLANSPLESSPHEPLLRPLFGGNFVFISFLVSDTAHQRRHAANW
jgi:hypothetical protein